MFNISFELNDKQSELLDVRLERSLYKLCSEEKLHSLIGSAICESELSAIIKKYGLSDVCDFSGLHISVAKCLVDCVVTMLYRYPKLRSRLCFIGSKKGYVNTVSKLIDGESALLKSLGLQYILSKDTAKQIGQAIVGMFDESTETAEHNTLAQAVSLMGILDGILLDESDFGQRDIRQIKMLLECSVLASHSPKGCASVESVIYHELGHLLDFLCGGSEDERLRSEYYSTPREIIANNLSDYAATSIEEYVAEGFSEYMSSDSPRATATHIKEIIDACYRRIQT